MRGMIARLWARIFSRRDPTPVGRVPLDPSGRPATGETQHLIMELGDPPFLIRPLKCLPGVPLVWASSDTSVVRLEVSTDTRSALARIVGVGMASLSVSDLTRCETRQVLVGQRPPPPIGKMGLTIEPHAA